jgi:hypothetical protein
MERTLYITEWQKKTPRGYGAFLVLCLLNYNPLCNNRVYCLNRNMVNSLRLI